MRNKQLMIQVLALLFIVTGVSAQSKKFHEDPKYGADSASRMECVKNLSIMGQYVKVKEYDYAYDAWKYVFENCPASTKNIYIRGAKILDNRIENAENDQAKNNAVDTLMLLYDRRIEHFNDAGFVNGLKGLDLMRYRPSDMEEAYKYLSKSVELSGDKIRESVAVTFMKVSARLLSKNIIEADQVVSDYLTVSENLNKKLESSRSSSRVEKAINDVEETFAETSAANCKNLVEIFTPKFNAAPEDVELLKKITTLLDKKDCEEDELYAKASEALYNLEPSAESAANLANLFLIKGKMDKSIEYYKLAIEQETDSEKKSDYYYQLGGIALKNKKYADARNNARKAIENNDKHGKAYILIGRAYGEGGSSCGSKDFEKKAVYWAVVDKFYKAKSVDPSTTEEANSLIKYYSSKFPTKEEVFFEGLKEGGAYKISGCWISETTTVRTN